jgi:hypothetical protein
MESRMPKFRSKPQVIEGWQFFREKLEDKASVPEWVASLLTIVAAKFVILDPETKEPWVEIFDGQWLMRMADGVYPLTPEALEAGFDLIVEEDTTVAGNA